MAKHLTQKDVQAILNIINSWGEEKLTWEVICAQSAQVIGKKPTRQSLNANKSIVDAYTAKKTSLKLRTPAIPKPNSLKSASARISRLESENKVLVNKNSLLRDMLKKWENNAKAFGKANGFEINEKKLNEQLPRIDRERSE